MIGLFALLFGLPLLLMFGMPWLFFKLGLFGAGYLVPAMLACPMFSGCVAWVWRRLYKDVPVVELLPRLLDEDNRSRRVGGEARNAERIRAIGTGLKWQGGPRLMRQVYEAVGRSRLKESWAGIGGWPDSWADGSVEELTGLLRRDAGEPLTQGGFGHLDRIRPIGKEIFQFGGIELMRKVYDRVRGGSVYFSEAVWAGIGGWEASCSAVQAGSLSCDLCGASAGANPRRISSELFRRAVQAGLLPPASMLQLGGALTGASKEQLAATWRAQVVSNATDWVLCESCARDVGRYRI
jgi:hypothetical protein